jgi:hypothetical protein
MPYLLCVELNSGANERENEIHIGPPPHLGDEIEVNLKSGRVKARVGSYSESPSKGGAGVSVVIKVYAVEI